MGFALGWLARTVCGQVPEGTVVARPIDAVQTALADIKRLAEEDRPYQRYIWLPPWGDTKQFAQVNSFAMNTAISRATTIQRPQSVGGYLARWDLRQLAPGHKALSTVVTLWERLAETEPYFHAQIRRDGLKATGFAVHAGNVEMPELATLAETAVPIVRADWLLVKSLTSLDGGLYYEFAGVAENQKDFLRSLGADEALAAEVNGDQRAGLFRSNVTGKPRRIDVFRGAGGRSSSGLVMVTRETVDGEIDAPEHPIRNLLKFQFKASEIIAEKANGLHVFALYDNFGKRQDSVPDNIASDHTVPPPHTRRVESAISCIRCHGPHDGVQPFSNDVQTLVSSRSVDVFTDLADQGDPALLLDRLAGLYAGNLGKPIRRARDDYQEAVFRATWGLDAAKAGELCSQQFAAYRYEQVTPAKAAMELGFKVDGKIAADALKWLVPHLPADERGVSPEDPVIASLLAGLSVNRSDFEQVYADIAVRASTRIEELKNHGKN